MLGGACCSVCGDSSGVFEAVVWAAETCYPGGHFGSGIEWAEFGLVAWLAEPRR